MRTIVKLSLIAACALAPSIALADSIGTVTVNASDVIYAAGTQSSVAGPAGGTVPGAITLVTGTTSFTFSTTITSTQFTLNGTGGINNDPDGFHNGTGAYGQTSSDVNGSGSISGITAPGAGYLVGVFLGPGGPTGTAPASLDYTSTDGSSYSPLLDQVFFIGDGLTGDGTGSTQTFYVPTGATELYLGLSDANGYNGTPGSYGDNHGTYGVSYDDITAVVPPPPPGDTPEPSSLALLGTGILGAAGVLRKKLARK
ncbi:MAG TPA: PEP-CTERM sorting domain-containing protein [Acidobacteriaceae bacterium]|jgi:hypothetical protein|nr:PEP-CTERM sorting domain-containing protein [Acidobacteriaceae bacterium]